MLSIAQADTSMLDALTLDQLRTFIAAAEQGSFSAAARSLRRTQSVVSQTLANLEAQLGLRLFDRRGRYPQLTAHGRLLLQDARRVTGGMSEFKARARSLAEGLEAELTVAVDAMYPLQPLLEAIGSFRETFVHTPLRLHVDGMGAVIEPVLDGRCRLGVVGPLPPLPAEFAAEPLYEVAVVTVAAPSHPLATAGDAPLPLAALAAHVQLLQTDRSHRTADLAEGLFSPQTWRLADLGTKHAFLRAGFGWGHMPLASVADDLAQGRLVRLQIEGAPAGARTVSMRAVYRQDAPPGPAGRWLLDRLKPQG